MANFVAFTQDIYRVYIPGPAQATMNAAGVRNAAHTYSSSLPDCDDPAATATGTFKFGWKFSSAAAVADLIANELLLVPMLSTSCSDCKMEDSNGLVLICSSSLMSSQRSDSFWSPFFPFKCKLSTTLGAPGR